MPWRELKPMDQKLLFIADYLRGAPNFSTHCTRYNISRKTGYKWVARYEEQGIDGLDEQSRCPHRSPHQTPYRIRQAIIELRTQGHSRPGPKKLQIFLSQRTIQYASFAKSMLLKSTAPKRRGACMPVSALWLRYCYAVLDPP